MGAATSSCSQFARIGLLVLCGSLLSPLALGVEPSRVGGACPNRVFYHWLGVEWEQAGLGWDGAQFVASFLGAKTLIASSDGIRWRDYGDIPTTNSISGISVSSSRTILQETEHGSFRPSRAFMRDGAGAAWVEAFTPEVARKYVQDGRGMIAAVARDGLIYTSADGYQWKKVVGIGAGRRLVYDVVPALDGGFLLLGDAALQRAANWDGAQFRFIARTQEISDALAVATSGKELVAVGKNGLVARSEDGVRWKVSTIASQLSGIDLIRVAWLNDEYVALGTCGTILESPDGITWSRFQAPEPTTFYGVAQGNGSLVVIGPPSFYGEGVRSFGVIYRRTAKTGWRQVVVPCRTVRLQGCEVRE